MLRPAVVALAVLAFVTSAFSAGVEADLQAFAHADLVFVGRVASSRLGPAVGRSNPPVYTVIITFDQVRMLRGARPADLTFSHQVRTRRPPSYARGAQLLVGVSRYAHDPSRFRLAGVAEPTEANVAIVRRMLTLPVGWSFEQDKPVSPWAALGKEAWPAGAKLTATVVCSKTGRPALLTNTGVVLKVEQVIPKDAHRFRNPYGDGKFRVTVTNTSKAAADVPALLTDGGRIAWADSLLVLNRRKAYLLGGAGSLKDPRQTRLKAGQGVSTVVDVLPIRGIPWPRGGSRVLFTFALGDLTARNFFYYFSRHHDRLRQAALKGAGPH